MSIAAAVLAAAPDGDPGPTSQLGRHVEKALADRAAKDAATPLPKLEDVLKPVSP